MLFKNARKTQNLRNLPGKFNQIVIFGVQNFIQNMLLKNNFFFKIVLFKTIFLFKPMVFENILFIKI